MFTITGPSVAGGLGNGYSVSLDLKDAAKSSGVRVSLGDDGITGRGVHATLSFGGVGFKQIDLIIQGPSTETFSIPVGAETATLTSGGNTLASLTVGKDS